MMWALQKKAKAAKKPDKMTADAEGQHQPRKPEKQKEHKTTADAEGQPRKPKKQKEQTKAKTAIEKKKTTRNAKNMVGKHAKKPGAATPASENTQAKKKDSKK